MTLVFCSECGYREYSSSKSLSQEFCMNCGAYGTMKEARLNIKERI